MRLRGTWTIFLALALAGWLPGFAVVATVHAVSHAVVAPDTEGVPASEASPCAVCHVGSEPHGLLPESGVVVSSGAVFAAPVGPLFGVRPSALAVPDRRVPSRAPPFLPCG
jgi:hypothetical protein